jgi:hypothetical protein
MHNLSALVARSIALRHASARLRRRASVLTTEAAAACATGERACRRAGAGWIGGGADGPISEAVTEPARACHLCTEPIDQLDPTVTHDNGEPVHVRCWRPPDPVRAPLAPFAESPMPPLEAFRSRPGRPPRPQPYGPTPKLR